MTAITKEEANKPLNSGERQYEIRYTHNSPQFRGLEAILREREFQDQKHGVLEEHGHTVGEWILIAQKELQEAIDGLLKGGTGRDAVMHELVQVAATCLAAIEQHGVGELPTKWGDR